MSIIEVTEISPGAVGIRHRFDHGGVIIGRHPDCDVVLNENHVSAQHARLVQTPRGLVLQELGSTNGSRVIRGDEVIALDRGNDYEVVLLPGDEILIGDPERPVCLRARGEVDSDPAPPEPTTRIEVLESLDLGDGAQVEELRLGLERDALLLLHQFSTRAASVRREADLLSAFSETVMALLPPVARVRIYMRASDDAGFVPALVLGRAGEEPARPLSRTLERLVRGRHEALSFAMGDPAFESADSLKRIAMGAGMCMPIFGGARVLGLVQVESGPNQTVPFAAPELGCVAVVAGHLGMAMENLRLNASLERTIGELRKAQQQMRSLAFEDALTGLSNRRLLQDRLEQALRLARRRERSVALLYLDLDDFKRINDSHGHGVGDQLLSNVAQRLRECLRGPDTLARLGGDEFAAVLQDLDGAAGARTVAVKMLEALRRPIQVPGHSIVVTASIGLTMAPADGHAVSELMRNADLAMYRAKARGGDTFYFFTEDMNRAAARRLEIEGEMRQGLATAQFETHYQPIVRLEDGARVAVEALARWNHPRHGQLLPGRFISVAEDTGLIVGLGQRVLEEACHDVRRLQQEGDPALRLAVNLSARQFREPTLPDMVAAALNRSGMDPTRLELEITESLLMEDSSEFSRRLARLKDLGASLIIDDFGTGYSSLAYLKRLPVDGVKIDRAFIEGIPGTHVSAEIASAIIAMANKLRLRVVAEGVENEDQLRFLRENGCTVYQGFLAGAPQPLSSMLGKRPEVAEGD